MPYSTDCNSGPSEFPESIVTVTLKFGPYLRADGSPVAQPISITPSVEVLDIDSGAVIMALRPVTLRASQTRVILPATDSPGLSPTDFTYQVTVGGVPKVVSLPMAHPVVDFDLLVSSEPSPGTIIWHPPTLPSGGEDGDVLAWADVEEGGTRWMSPGEWPGVQRAEEAAQQAEQARDGMVVGGTVDGDDLVLSTVGGDTIVAGNVRGQKGDPGTASPEFLAGVQAAQDAQAGAEEARDEAEQSASQADASKTGAETAQGLAVTARTGAETAQGLAEDARDGAVAARDEAEAARDEAEAARDEAEAARDETLAAAGGGGTGAVTSVNGQTGAVSLGAADVGADPAGTAAGLVGALAIPDSADDVGAIPDPAVEGASGDVLVTDGAGGRTWATPDAGGVTSVDGQTGAVSLSSTYVAQANLTVTPGASVSGSNTGDQTLPTWTTLAGKPAVVAAGATQADARTAIGAGTSNLTIGTTSTTAKAGDYTPPDASTTVKGVVKLATTAEVTTGTDTTRAVTPAGVAAAIAGVGGGVTDHGALSGLADDDHTLYALADGTRGAFAATSHTHTASQISDAIIATGSSVSGSNTGDQDLSGYALSTQTINAQTGTTYTLVASDASKLVTCTNSGAITVTVPASTFAAGQRVDLLVLGAGMVTVAAGSGMTLNGTPSLVSRAQYSALTVLFLSATSAVVIGDLATP